MLPRIKMNSNFRYKNIQPESIKILKEIILDEQSTLHSSKTTFIRTYVGLLLGKRWDLR